MSILIKNGTVLKTENGLQLEKADVLIEGSVIKKVGKISSEEKPGKVIDAQGKYVFPGMICAHHHFYSGLSRGMMIHSGPQRDLIQILDQWWWRLDRALDEQSLYYSALICCIDAIKCGTTACIDHNESPSFISDSLSVISSAFEKTGLRGITTYGITERNNGVEELKAGTDECVRFIKEIQKKKKQSDVLCEGMIGGHALFTISDEGLEMLSQAVKETSRGLHIHVAEGSFDSEYSHFGYGKDLMTRLLDFDLLSDKTLIAHGIFLNKDEIETLNNCNCYLAHNPRSNMNNRVGYLRDISKVKNLILGTDGCSGNMFEEMKIAFLKNRELVSTLWPSDFYNAVLRSNKLVGSYFDKKLGSVSEGYTADLIILDYLSPTPMNSDNIAGHLVWGMSSNSVCSTIVNGKVLFDDHRFTDLDVDEIYSKAREQAEKLWQRTDRI